MTNQPALSVSNLTVNYDKTTVLWDISFSIPQGNLVGIIGPNGAGKSTLLKAILGMTPITSGSVSFLGDHSLKKIRKQLAYVPQRSSVDWDFPVRAFDVVLMGRYGKMGWLRFPRDKDKKAAYEALEKVGMLAFADRQISQLSGGQQQRIFLARALVQEADMYFMDEPFAGVDMATEQAIFGLLDTLKSQGKTLFIVHHDLNSVQKYFSWLVMLNTSLVSSGPTKEVFHRDFLLKTYGRGFCFLDDTCLSAKQGSKSCNTP